MNDVINGVETEEQQVEIAAAAVGQEVPKPLPKMKKTKGPEAPIVGNTVKVKLLREVELKPDTRLPVGSILEVSEEVAQLLTHPLGTLPQHYGYRPEGDYVEPIVRAVRI